MEAHGMSQVDFARKSGTHAAAVCHWLSGRREPGISNLTKLIKALPCVRVDWLITGENL